MRLAAMILQALGTLITIGALLSTWREHGEGRPLIPRPSRAGWARILRRRRDVAVQGATARGSITLDGGAAGARAEPDLPEDAPMNVVMRVFENRMSFMVGEKVDRVAGEMAAATAEARQADAELRQTVTKVAVGSIRAQMVGLIFIGFGTVLGYWG